MPVWGSWGLGAALRVCFFLGSSCLVHGSHAGFRLSRLSVAVAGPGVPKASFIPRYTHGINNEPASALKVWGQVTL